MKLLLPFRVAARRVEAPSEVGWLPTSLLQSFVAAGSFWPLDALMLLVTANIFADHNQFYVFDSNFDHFKDPDLDWTASPKQAYGYLASKRAIYVSTVASLNSHRLRIFLNEDPISKYERVFSSDLLITSGVLKVSAPANAPEDDVQIQLTCGAYRVSICSSAIGIDELILYPNRVEQMSDEELFTHDNLEYYDLFVQSCA